LLQGTLSQSSSDYHATRSLGAVARKAQELLKRQRQIDQDVSRQWGDTHAAGASWAGQVQLTKCSHGRVSCNASGQWYLGASTFASYRQSLRCSLHVQHRRCAAC
jgi:hypothetical protein